MSQGAWLCGMGVAVGFLGYWLARERPARWDGLFYLAPAALIALAGVYFATVDARWPPAAPFVGVAISLTALRFSSPTKIETSSTESSRDDASQPS